MEFERTIDFFDATIQAAATFAWGYLWISIASLVIYGVILAMDEAQHRSLSEPKDLP